MVTQHQPELRELILEHIARYRITFQPTLERVFGEFGSIRSEIASLKRDGLIKALGPKNGYRSLLGGYTAYQLTPIGAKAIGASPKRAKKLNENALESSFRLLWLCCMSKRRYSHLTQAHVTKLFENPLKSKDCPYCIEPTGKRTVYLVRLLGERSEDDYALRETRKDLVAVSKIATARDFVEHGRYGNLIAVSKPERKKRIEERVKARSLKDLGRVRIEIVPDLAEIKDAFRAG